MPPQEELPEGPTPLPGTPSVVPVPPGLAETFGYRGRARFVAFHWEPAGDEVVYDDGRLSGTGASHAFLAYRRHPKVAAHLEAYNLGYSDVEAEHCLLLDRESGTASITPLAAARAFLREQHPPPPEVTAGQLEEVRRAVEAAVRKGWHEVRVDPEVIRRALEEQRQALTRLLAALDGWPGG
jgi:hypothetical protein